MFAKTHSVYKVFQKETWRRETNPNYALFSINVLVPTWLSWNADDKDGALMLWHRSWDMRVGFGRPQFMTGLKIQHRRWPGRIYSQKISLRHFYIGKIYCQKGSVLYLHVGPNSSIMDRHRFLTLLRVLIFFTSAFVRCKPISRVRIFPKYLSTGLISWWNVHTFQHPRYVIPLFHENAGLSKKIKFDYNYKLCKPETSWYANKTIGDEGITVDFGLSKSIE